MFKKIIISFVVFSLSLSLYSNKYVYIIYKKKREEIETQKRKNMCMYATNKKPFNLNLFHSLVIVFFGYC